MNRPLFLMLLVAGCGDLLYVDELPQAQSLGVAADLEDVRTLRYYALDGVLRAHVREVAAQHLVQYEAMLSSPEARQTVADAQAQLSGVAPLNLVSADEQLAFWLNRYNLAMVDAVLQRLEANDGFTSVSDDNFAVFSTPSVQVAGAVLTLDQLENGILRGEFDILPDDLRDRAKAWHAGVWDGGPADARLHMGLNCASIGCPNLPIGAFQANIVYDQLDEASTAFVNNVDKGAGPGGVSELFTWFEDDFVTTFGSVEGFVEAYRTGGAGDVAFGTSIPYDWSLNKVNP